MFRLYCLWLLILLAFNFSLYAQEGRSGDALYDSLKLRLSKAQTAPDKVRGLLDMSVASVLDPLMSELYMKQAVQAAELSRDRPLMARTYLAVGRRYMNIPGLSDNLERAIDNFSRAEKIGRENNLDLLLIRTYSALSQAWQFKGDREKSLSYCNQALSVAGNIEDDTASVIAYASIGDFHLETDQKLLAFRNFLEALRVAEKSEKEELLKEVYTHLERFYASIHEYGKAIDYRMMVYGLDRKAWKASEMVADEYHLGDLFGQNKQEDLALKMYENAIGLADSLHYDLFKVDPYFRIFNMYFNTHQYVKGFNYLKDHQSIVIFLRNSGYQFYLDQLYAMSLTEQGKFDSAGYYFRRAEPEMEKRTNPETHYNFYTSFGDYLIRKNDYRQAIA